MFMRHKWKPSLTPAHSTEGHQVVHKRWHAWQQWGDHCISISYSLCFLVMLIKEEFILKGTRYINSKANFLFLFTQNMPQFNVFTCLPNCVVMQGKRDFASWKLRAVCCMVYLGIKREHVGVLAEGKCFRTKLSMCLVWRWEGIRWFLFLRMELSHSLFGCEGWNHSSFLFGTRNEKVRMDDVCL